MKHPLSMSLPELKRLPSISRSMKGEKPQAIFYAHGTRWGVFDSSDTPGQPFWVACYGGKDPNPELGDRISAPAA